MLKSLALIAATMTASVEGVKLNEQTPVAAKAAPVKTTLAQAKAKAMSKQVQAFKLSQAKNLKALAQAGLAKKGAASVAQTKSKAGSKALIKTKTKAKQVGPEPEPYVPKWVKDFQETWPEFQWDPLDPFDGVFWQLDENHDGHLDAAELSLVMDGGEEEASGDLVATFDQDGDGLISMEEFKSIVRELLLEEFHKQTGGADLMSFDEVLPMMSLALSGDASMEIWERKNADQLKGLDEAKVVVEE